MTIYITVIFMLLVGILIGITGGYSLAGHADRHFTNKRMKAKLALEHHDHMMKWRLIDTFCINGKYDGEYVNIYVHMFYNNAGMRKWESYCNQALSMAKKEFIQGTWLGENLYRFSSGEGDREYWEKVIDQVNTQQINNRAEEESK